MSLNSSPDAVFIVAWAFEVKPQHRRDFERAYGQNGEWVRLFRNADGYLKTELHRSPEGLGRYVTLDFWRTREQYAAFREHATSEYKEIDARCERLTVREKLVGDFTDLASLNAACPQLGSETEVGPTCTVRPATPDDISEIMRLEQATPSAAHWTKDAYEAIWRDEAPARIALVAESVDRKLSGFVVARLAADECELENIVVEQRETRLGIGSALIQELSRETRIRGGCCIVLEVRESNRPARALYEKLGFQREGERAAYYSDPVENAILYSLAL